MTVAAVVLAAQPESALRDVEGVPNARRLADTAWAGGAFPIVVVSFDPEGAVAAALAGSPAVLAAPAAREAGPVGQICRGIDVARAEVDGTDAALVWPARMGWVDAETVTSLIEAHGTDRAAVLRPAFGGEAGWPALVPVAHLDALRALDPALMPGPLVDALVNAVGGRVVDLGDPGAVHDLDTPRSDLPPFEAPPEPAAAHHHEWGSAAASGPDEPPEPARTID
jgi:CTP:molybdopterin cytidylyltransferase MocA